MKNMIRKNRKFQPSSWNSTKLGQIIVTHFILIFLLFSGDPCVHPERIPSRAPEVYCQNGRLVGATRSSQDHIVIGMVQSGQRYAFGNYAASQISNRCTRRKNQGYRSGMGRIFIEVASINPIN